MRSTIRTSHSTRRRKLRVQSAFTLIELIVVIMIIAILSSLLMVGIQGAVNRARVTAVVVDVKNLEQGIKEFQAKYNITDAPPSFLILAENDTLWNSNSTPANNAIFRRIWPGFLQTNNRPTFNVDTDSNMTFDAYQQDINGDGDHDDVFILNGAECLAFFLGGIMEKDGSNFIPRGFSSNPTNPFYRPTSPTGSWGTRVGPFADLKPSRLVDIADPVASTPLDDMPVYIDAFPNSTTPYLYLSAYGGRGYRLSGPDGLNSSMAQKADDEVLWVDASTPALYSVYLQKDSETDKSKLPAGTPWSAKSFQIICAGADAQWGIGGQVNAEGILDTVDAMQKVSNDVSPFYRSLTNPMTGAIRRLPERDNITSFKGGLLN